MNKSPQPKQNNPNFFRRPLVLATEASLAALGLLGLAGCSASSGGSVPNQQTTAAASASPSAESSGSIPQSDINELGVDYNNSWIKPSNSKECYSVAGAEKDYNKLLVQLDKAYPGQESNLWYNGSLLPDAAIPVIDCSGL